MLTTFESVAKKARRKPLFERADSSVCVQIGRDEIERLLPHREPLLLVDRIAMVDLEQETLEASRQIDPQDPVFKGHFPGQPVYPGALLVEAMGQASLCLHQLLEHQRTTVLSSDHPAPLRLLRVQHALFAAEVVPGDEITLLSKRLVNDSYTVVCAGQVVRNQTICATAIMEVFLADEA